jgi:hypothetical protein
MRRHLAGREMMIVIDVIDITVGDDGDVSLRVD